jgi:deoxyadenosine/deoxycytidine kinase
VGKAFKNLKVIALECRLETLLKRIKKRGRKFELEYYTESYLDRINRGLKELKKKLEREGIQVMLVKERELKGFLNQEAVSQRLITKVTSGLMIR